MALDNAFERHGLFCHFKPKDMFYMLKQLETEMRNRGRATGECISKKLLLTAGRHNSLIFLSPTQIINLADGSMAAPDDLDVVWIPSWPGTNLPREDLFHSIQQPVALEPLKAFFEKAHEVLENNFPAALLAWSSMYMLHFYKWIMDNIRHFNVPVLYGEPTVGKTLVAQCGMWLNGCQDIHFASRCTPAFLMQWISLSSMPFVWDDPTNPEDLGQLSVDLGNGAVRGRASDPPQTPLTGCLVTANFDLSSVARHYSRLAIFKMGHPRKKDQGSAKELETMAHAASAALPLVLSRLAAMQVEDVHETTGILSESLTADIRVLEGLALPLTVTEKLLDLTDLRHYMDHVESYVNEVLIPYHNKNLGTERRQISISGCLKQLKDVAVDEIKENILLKAESLVIRRAFLNEHCNPSAELLKQIQLGGGSSRRSVRMRGKIQHCAVILTSQIEEELLQWLRLVMRETELQRDRQEEGVVAVIEDDAAVVQDNLAVIEDNTAIEDDAAVVQDNLAIIEGDAAVVQDYTPEGQEDAAVGGDGRTAVNQEEVGQDDVVVDTEDVEAATVVGQVEDDAVTSVPGVRKKKKTVAKTAKAGNKGITANTDDEQTEGDIKKNKKRRTVKVTSKVTKEIKVPNTDQTEKGKKKKGKRGQKEDEVSSDQSTKVVLPETSAGIAELGKKGTKRGRR